MKNIILLLSLLLFFGNTPNSLLAQCNCTRPDATSGFMVKTDQDIIDFQHIDCGDFRLHYTLTLNEPNKIHAVTQTYIDNIVTYLTEAKNKYAAMGYTLPLIDGGLGGSLNKYDVYVFNMQAICGLIINGQTCGDFIQQDKTSSAFMFLNTNLSATITVNEPGFALEAPPSNLLRSTVVHEFFHMVQHAYRNPQALDPGSSSSKFLREGTAAWAESLFDITYEYPEGSGTNITTEDKGFYLYNELLKSTYRGFLMDENANSTTPYSNVFFWTYLAERFGNDIIKTIWTNYKNNGGKEYDAYNQAVSPHTFKEVKEDFWLTHLFMTQNLNSHNFLKNNSNYSKYTYSNNNSIDGYTPNGNAEVLDASSGNGTNIVLYDVPVIDVPQVLNGITSFQFYCGIGTYGFATETRMYRMGASYFKINANIENCFNLTIIPKMAPANGSTCFDNFESNYLPNSSHPEYFEAILVFRDYLGDPDNEENLNCISVVRKMYNETEKSIKFAELKQGSFDIINLIIYRHIPVYGNGQSPKIEEFEVLLENVQCPTLVTPPPCSPNVDKTTNSPKEYLNITNYIVYNLLGNKIFEGTQTTDNTIEIKNKLSYFPKGVYIITHFGENGEMLKSNKFINTK